MKKIKLSELQNHRLDESRRNAAEVLRVVKQENLSDDALDWMKELEIVVQMLEGLKMWANRR